MNLTAKQTSRITRAIRLSRAPDFCCNMPLSEWISMMAIVDDLEDALLDALPQGKPRKP